MERRASFSVKVTLGLPYRRVRLTYGLQEAGMDYNERAIINKQKLHMVSVG